MPKMQEICLADMWFQHDGDFMFCKYHFVAENDDFLWVYVKSIFNSDKPLSIAALEANIGHANSGSKQELSNGSPRTLSWPTFNLENLNNSDGFIDSNKFTPNLQYFCVFLKFEKSPR